MFRSLTLTDSDDDKALFALLYEVFLGGVAVLQNQGKRTADDVRKEAKILRKLRALSIENADKKTGLGAVQRQLKAAGAFQIPQPEHATLLKYLDAGAVITAATASVEVVDMLEKIEAMDKVESTE